MLNKPNYNITIIRMQEENIFEDQFNFQELGDDKDQLQLLESQELDEEIHRVALMWEQIAIVRILKSTNNSKVYKCVLKETKEAVILKIGNISKQAKILQTLQHPHMMKILMARQNSILIPQYEGTLRQLMNKSGSLPLETAVTLKMLKDILKSLLYLTQNELIHGDLTPDNIFYQKSESLQISFILGDFGNSFSKQKEFEEKMPTQTAPYRAPEQMNHLRSWEKIDTWSLGCIIFQCITGDSVLPLDLEEEQFEEAVQSLTGAEINSRMQRFSTEQNRKIFGKLIIEHLLRQNPKDRFCLRQLQSWILSLQ